MLSTYSSFFSSSLLKHFSQTKQKQCKLMELLRKRPTQHTRSNNNKIHIKDRGEHNFFFFSHLIFIFKLMQSTTFELIKFRLNVRHISILTFFCLFLSINAVECACEFKGKLYKVRDFFLNYIFLI